jgi:hypothetical protein
MSLSSQRGYIKPLKGGVSVKVSFMSSGSFTKYEQGRKSYGKISIALGN